MPGEICHEGTKTRSFSLCLSAFVALKFNLMTTFLVSKPAPWREYALQVLRDGVLVPLAEQRVSVLIRAIRGKKSQCRLQNCLDPL